MTLDQGRIKQKLKIEGLVNSDHLSDRESRLLQLGFVQGAELEIRHRVPLFQEPMLVEVRGRLIALTLDEASQVRVSLC